LHVRIVFVGYSSNWAPTLIRWATPGFRSSQIDYAISIPGSPSCPTVSLMSPRSEVETYIQFWQIIIDLACSGTIIPFPVEAFTVPVSTTPSGTFIYECEGPACPPDFATPGIHDIHAVAKTNGMEIPIESFTSGQYHIFITFIPDDPNQLPTRIEDVYDVQQASSCPLYLPETNGPPPAP